MKLINLEVEGLNSFQNKTSIDFKSLFDKGFFGIFGATGSGKSSILDSVFFALYGKVLRVKNEFEFINIKRKSAKVKLVFEMRDKGVDKIFEVSRVYRINAKNEVTKSAEIFLINGDEKTSLAKGDEQTTKKVCEIVGFDENQFRRFIALPQGQFSQFLKDSPKNKIETMAKVFNLEKYGEKFANNLKSQRSENLKRKSYLAGVLDQYVDVDAGTISAEEDQAKNLQKQLKTKEAELSKLKNEYLEAERNFELIKQKENIEEKLKELDVVQEEIDKDTKNLAIFKASYTLNPLFSKITHLKKEKESLNIELDRLTDEINATSASYIKAVAFNDKQKTDLSIKLAELERRQSLLLAIRSDAERYRDLEKQKNLLLSQVEKESNALEKLKSIYDSHSLSLENNIRIIQDLEEFVVHDNIDGNVIDAVKKFEQLKSYNDAVKLSLDDVNFEKNIVTERKNVLLKELVQNDEKLNLFKEQIRKVNESLKEMFDGETSFEKATINATNRLAFLKLQGTDFIEREIEIKHLKDQASKILAQIKNEQEIQKNIVADLDKVKIEITNEANQEFFDKDKIKKLKELQKELKESFSGSKQTQLILDEKRDYILSEANKLQRKQKELVNENEAFKDLSIEKLENKILSAENLVYKLVELASSLDRAKESAQVRERACVKISASIDELSKEEQSLISKAQKLEKSLEDAGKKLEEFESLNRDGLLKSAQAYDENFNSQIVILTQQKGVIPQIIKFVDLKQKAADNYFDAKAKLDQKQAKLEQTSLDMKLILNKLRSLNVKGYIKDEIANNFSAIESLRQTLKNITDSESEILKNETNLKIQKASIISSLVIKEEEIENASKQLEGECRLASITENDLNTKIAYNDITELESKINKHNEQKIEALKDLQRVKAQITNTKITQAKLIQIKESIEKVENANSNMKAEITFLLKQIEKDKANVKKLAYFKAELNNTIKKENLFAKLTSLNEDDSILKFLTEEYILQITEKANTYFATLTNGRFQLIYSGDFQILDNLNGGLTRSVGTLSGGETFLASLSLAIAIVEVVSLLHDKPLDFVFLDEGFGTLDENSIEMVMTALRKLRSTKLVFGLITHEQLVKYKTPTRIEVYKSAENGSRIETVI